MGIDLTREAPDRTLWRFLLPLMGSVVFQQLYNIADSVIAGQFAGEAALAAVGASYPITVIFMAFGVGSSLGTSVVVSRLFGAQQYRRMKEAISTALLAALGLGMMLTLIGYFGSGAMMRLIHTPADIFADGALYLKVYAFGILFLLLYNVCTGIFTAFGDSRTPLLFLIVSSVGNILLDLLFVAVFRLGVPGAAWATFLAQSMSAVLLFLTLLRRLRCFTEKGKEGGKRKLFDSALFWAVAAIAVPSILQQSVLSIGSLFVQDTVNTFGSAVIAGYAGAIKLNTFAINTFMTLGSCLSSYTAQNLGAGKQERIPLGFQTGLKLSLFTAIPFVLLYFGASEFMMGLFLRDESREALLFGSTFLKIVSPMYLIISIKLMTDGIIRGSGAMTYFVIATIPDLVLRIVLARWFSGLWGSVGIAIAWPFGWVVTTLLTLLFYRAIRKKQQMASIKSKAVDKEALRPL